jgi:hypothetical protein
VWFPGNGTQQQRRTKEQYHSNCNRGSVLFWPMIPRSLSVDESFELLNPFIIATDKAHKHQIYQQILYPHGHRSSQTTVSCSCLFFLTSPLQNQISSQDHHQQQPDEIFRELCPLCLSDFMKVMKDTRDNYKLILKKYDQRLNYLMNIYPPSHASGSSSGQRKLTKSEKLIETILDLERKEEALTKELISLEHQSDNFADEISLMNEEIRLLEREKNSLQEEEQTVDDDFLESGALLSATRSEIILLSQNFSSKSLFSMSWKSSFFIISSSSSPSLVTVQPAPPFPSNSSLSLSSFLTQSLPLAVFSITPHTTTPTTPSSPSPSSSTTLEQKILSVNRIRISYCPVSSCNLNWGEICLGWSIVGTFLQGFLHEMVWISAEISSSAQRAVPLRWTFRMVLLRGKVVFVRAGHDDEEEDEGERAVRDGVGKPLYRLSCTEEEVPSSHHSMGEAQDYIGSSDEYQTALICLGIVIIELADALQEVLQSHWSTIDPLGFGSLSRCPALRSLKSFSLQSSSLYRQTLRWPNNLHEITKYFPDKGAYILLVNDILTMVSHLQTLHLED